MMQLRGEWFMGGRSAGQSTLEYLLVVVAVLVAILVAVKGGVEPKVSARMNEAGAIIDKAGTELRTATGTGSTTTTP